MIKAINIVKKGLGYLQLVPKFDSKEKSMFWWVLPFKWNSESSSKDFIKTRIYRIQKEKTKLDLKSKCRRYFRS